MWRKYGSELKIKKDGYTLVVDVDPYNGKHSWRISKGYVQWANGSAPTIDQAQKDALYWVWGEDPAQSVIQCLVDDGLLSWSRNVKGELIAWTKTIENDPFVAGTFIWVAAYADHLKGNKVPA